VRTDSRSTSRFSFADSAVFSPMLPSITIPCTPASIICDT
jgi:hypothetical protein